MWCPYEDTHSQKAPQLEFSWIGDPRRQKKSEETKDRIELGALSDHAKIAKCPRVYFRTCINAKADQSTSHMVSQYLTTRSFLSLSEQLPLQHVLAAWKKLHFLS